MASAIRAACAASTLSPRPTANALQYSLFVCDLDEVQLVGLERDLGSVIAHREDRISIFDLGPPSGRGVRCVRQLGLPQLVPKVDEAEIW